MHVTIGAKRGLAIEAPSAVPVSAGADYLHAGQPGERRGEGDVPGDAERDERARAGASRSGRGERHPVTVQAAAPGSYEATFWWMARSWRPAFTRVVQEGVPSPPPIRLHADVSGSIDTSRELGLLREGAGVAVGLPDDHRCALRRSTVARARWRSMRPAGWRRSAHSAAPRWDCPLPSELGVRGAYKDGPWAVGGGATWIGADRFAGYAFGGRKDEHTTYAGAVGMHAGTPMAVRDGRARPTRRAAGRSPQRLLDGSISGSAAPDRWTPARTGRPPFRSALSAADGRRDAPDQRRDTATPSQASTEA